MSIDFELPSEFATQQLVGAVFGESSTKSTGGADSDEKLAIAQAIINIAFYALKKSEGSKKCNNGTFGDGTTLEAIKKCIVAYDGVRWRLVMFEDKLRSKEELELILDKDNTEHLKDCVNAVKIAIQVQAPISNSKFNRIPLQFNQAENTPPSPRMEKIGSAGRHTFYSFKLGRECQ